MAHYPTLDHTEEPSFTIVNPDFTLHLTIHKPRDKTCHQVKFSKKAKREFKKSKAIDARRRRDNEFKLSDANQRKVYERINPDQSDWRKVKNTDLKKEDWSAPSSWNKTTLDPILSHHPVRYSNQLSQVRHHLLNQKCVPSQYPLCQ